MCGICGYVGMHEDGLLARMTSALSHRGPDDQDFFEEDGAGLGHRRLSIIDLAGGRQPMRNEDGSLVLICNGEIYNYRELRKELQSRGHTLRTVSDCEVLLHLYEDYGPDCLKHILGMYAFAIYDRKAQRLFVARDRLGIKPLYYAQVAEGFLFASEIKAILRCRAFKPSVDPQAVHDYLQLRYVPGPGCMFRGLCKLPAGHYATVEQGRMKLAAYWKPELFSGPFPRSDAEYLDEFGERFERSIQRRMIADVPVGAYLSSGLDSSTIVATMSRLVSHPLRTFTVGFDYQHDELAQAAATAKLLGCQHTEISCGAADLAVLPRIIYHLDEPLGDPIVIPMYLLAREAKKQVTVVLTGEGADETLGGYLFHRALLMGDRLRRLAPQWLRAGLLQPALAMTPAALLNLAFEYPASLGARGKRKVQDFLKLLEPEALPDAYRHLISLFDARDACELYTSDFHQAVATSAGGPASGRKPENGVPYLNRVIHLQFDHWLPDDILTKQDKTSMAWAVEARVPFLDHELVEFVLRVPPSLKIRNGHNKLLLRQYAQRILPHQVTHRRKMPFYFPLEKYIEHPALKEMLEDTLSEQSVRQRGWLRPEGVARIRQAMRRGEFIHVKQAFSLVALELWCRIFVDRGGNL